MEEMHEGAMQGRLEEVRNLAEERRQLAYCRDQQGASPLHKAVLFQQRALVAYFVQHFPAVMHTRDHQGRTPLHYAAVLQDNGEIYRMLKTAGSDENATDVYGHTPDFYLDAPGELTLEQLKEGTSSSRSKKAKHRRRKSGENSTASIRGYSAKPAGLKVQIREIIGQGNLEALEELVLHGHGDRLLGETSPNPVVQEFLDIVPGYIEQISDVHRAVIRGRLREVQTLMSHRSLSLARDSMGATPIHKAVMHGHVDVAQHLADNFRDSLSAKDVEGRTPLHYAAALRDGRKMYNMLIAAGSPTTIVDSKGKTADYYLQYPEKLGLEQIIKRNQLANATHLGNTVSRLKALAPPYIQKTIVNMHERYHHSNGGLNGNHEAHLNGDDEKVRTEENRSFLSYFFFFFFFFFFLCVCHNQSEGSQDTAEDKAAAHLVSQQESLKKVMMRTKPMLPPVILPRLEVNSANIRKWIDEQDLQKLEGAVFEGYGERLAKEPSVRHEQFSFVFLAAAFWVHLYRSFTCPRAIIISMPHHQDIQGVLFTALFWLSSGAVLFGGSSGHGEHQFQGCPAMNKPRSLTPQVEQYLRKDVPRLLERIQAIHRAVSDDDVRALESQLQSPDYALARDHLGMTPLHRAVVLGRHDVARLLVDRFPETINARDREGRTALHYAAAASRRSGRADMYRLLLQNGSDPRIRDNRGKSSEYYKTHHLQLAPEIAQMSSSARDKARSRSEPPGSRPRRNSHASTALHEKLTAALQKGDPAEVRELVLEGHGRHLLGRTSWNEEVRHLLKSLPQFLHQVRATHEAIGSGDLAKLKDLAASDAQLLRARSDLGCHPMHAAIEARNLEAARLILDAFPAAIKLKAPHGRNPLHLAALRRDHEMFKFLVDSGADPKALDQKGKTAEYYLKNSRKRRSRSTASTHETSRERSSSVQDTKAAAVETAARSTELETITVPADKGALGAVGDAADGVGRGDESAERAGATNEEATEPGGNESGQSGSSDGGGKGSATPASASSESGAAAAKDAVVEGAMLGAVIDGPAPNAEAAGALPKDGRSDQQELSGEGAVDASSSSSSSSDSPPTVVTVSPDDGAVHRVNSSGLIKEGQRASGDAETEVAKRGMVGAGVEEIGGEKNGEDAKSIESSEQRNIVAMDEGVALSSKNAVSETSANGESHVGQGATADVARQVQNGDVAGELLAEGYHQKMSQSEGDHSAGNKSDAVIEDGSKECSQANTSLTNGADESKQLKVPAPFKELQGLPENGAAPHVMEHVELLKDSRSGGVTPELKSVVDVKAKSGAEKAATPADQCDGSTNSVNRRESPNVENIQKESSTGESGLGGKCESSAGGGKTQADDKNQDSYTQCESDKSQASEVMRDQQASNSNEEENDPVSGQLKPDSALVLNGPGLSKNVLKNDHNANSSDNTFVDKDNTEAQADTKEDQSSDRGNGTAILTKSNDITLELDKSNDHVIAHGETQNEMPKAIISSEAMTGGIENAALEVDGADSKDQKDSNESQDKKPLETAKKVDQGANEDTNKPPSSKLGKKSKLVPDQKPAVKPVGAKEVKKNGMQNPRRSSSMASMKEHLSKTSSRHSLNIDEKNVSKDTKHGSSDTRTMTSSMNEASRANSVATLVTGKSGTEQKRGDPDGARPAAKGSSDIPAILTSSSHDHQGDAATLHKLTEKEADREDEHEGEKEQEGETTIRTEHEIRDRSASQSQKSLSVAAFDATKEEVLQAQGSVGTQVTNEDTIATRVPEGAEENPSIVTRSEAIKQHGHDIQSSGQEYKGVKNEQEASFRAKEDQMDSQEQSKDQEAVSNSSVASVATKPTKEVAPKEQVGVDSDNALNEAPKSKPRVSTNSHEKPEPGEPRQRSAGKRPNDKGIKVSSNTSAQLDRLNELIDVWIKEGDLLRLEHVVIAGQGERLLNKTSDDKQVQEFLGLVPAYMDRIRTVHEAVVSGNMAQVRQVLTRKRFALSRDRLGASPLHLAVLHGHTDVLNYIVERFPETLDGPDNEGRTPLHYAAVVLEAQNYFDILKKAGADEAIKDKMGHTPEYYLKNPKELSIRDLLANYHTPTDDDKSAKADVWQRPSTPAAAADAPEALTVVPEAPSAPVAPAANGGVAQPAVLPDGKPQQQEAAPEVTASEASKTTNSVPSVEAASNAAPEAPPAPGQVAAPPVPTEKGVRQPVDEPLQTAVQLPLGEHAASRATAATGQPASTTLPAGKNGQNGGADMVQLAQSLLLTGRTSEEAQYLSSSVGDALVGALAAVAKQRPPDPVAFVASWLKQNQMVQDRPTTRAPNATMPAVNSKNRDNEVASRANTISSSATSDDSLRRAGFTNPFSEEAAIEETEHYMDDYTRLKDEEGQTVLHFAASHAHSEGCFYALVRQGQALLAERDSRYRTARDVAREAQQTDNVFALDAFVLDAFLERRAGLLRALAHRGYEPLLHAADRHGRHLTAVLAQFQMTDMQALVHDMDAFFKTREELHAFVRNGYLEGVQQLVKRDVSLVTAKGTRGRCALHVAVLVENPDVVRHLVKSCPDALHVADNMGRTPLHYAMAMPHVTTLGQILVQGGASRTARDVKMRTPSYFFIYKQEILKLKEEESPD
ncbi:uncharacterized protein [Dermacentor andersoni]|uniref:uncharacterized protein n=1 Tax=Dermacentor andersoni TaxID=34620 RepID=UPI0024166BBE|nr:uncharacterized protein LOC126540686 [Dermacentor andersoni]